MVQMVENEGVNKGNPGNEFVSIFQMRALQIEISMERLAWIKKWLKKKIEVRS